MPVETDVEKKTLRAASGTLTSGETTASVGIPSGMNEVVVTLDVTVITTVDADDEVDFFFQTTFDDGVTWFDIANVHFTTSDNGATAKRIIRFKPAGAATIVTPAQIGGTRISDNTILNTMSVGDQMRIDLVFTNPGGTAPAAAYNAVLYARCAA